MTTMPDPVARFLRCRRLAVAGVSRQPGETANVIFNKLRHAGYEVFPVNPNAPEVEGVRCYRDVGAIPGGVEGVVIATHPNVSAEIVRQAAQCGVPRVWLHRSFGNGSASAEAVAEAKRLKIECIEGLCPLMFCEPVDFPHKCMRWWLLRWGASV